MAPAGSFAALTAALDGGADAVYLGVHRFTMRARSRGFEPDDLDEAVRRCHDRGARMYLTVMSWQ